MIKEAIIKKLYRSLSAEDKARILDTLSEEDKAELAGAVEETEPATEPEDTIEEQPSAEETTETEVKEDEVEDTSTTEEPTETAETPAPEVEDEAQIPSAVEETAIPLESIVTKDQLEQLIGRLDAMEARLTASEDERAKLVEENASLREKFLGDDFGENNNPAQSTETSGWESSSDFFKKHIG